MTDAEREMTRRSRRGFLALGVGAVAGVAGWRWLMAEPSDGGVPGRLRSVLHFDERVTRTALYRDGHLAPEFPRNAARMVRANGDIGLGDDVADADWRLEVVPYKSTEPVHKLDAPALRALPKVEHTTEFKCVEGWSTIVHWGGARLSDFTERYAKSSDKARYVSMQTPDGEYYVGLDMASALHPQTLLCYEMNGEPLTGEHGAPLRLAIPVKYGIKNIKRIGRISYTDERPDDYWAERGYDYYAAL